MVRYLAAILQNEGNSRVVQAVKIKEIEVVNDSIVSEKIPNILPLIIRNVFIVD